MENSKIIKNFKELRTTEKAILVSATLPEIGREMEFWLPKSKVEIDGQNLLLDEAIYESKLEELKNPKQEEMLIVHSKVSEKGEKATKLILNAQLNEDHDFELWIFIPNSRVESSEEVSENDFKVTIPEWLYDNSVNAAIDKQLEFFNKEQNLYGRDDIKILSKVKRKK